MFIATRIFASALLLAAPLAPLAAQSSFDNEAELPRFTVENIQPALTAAGATEIEVQADDTGSQRLRVVFDSSVLVITPTACTEGEGCRGLSMRAYWRPDVGLDQEQIARQIADYNETAISPVAYSNGVASISFYIIGDYGICLLYTSPSPRD